MLNEFLSSIKNRMWLHCKICLNVFVSFHLIYDFIVQFVEPHLIFILIPIKYWNFWFEWDSFLYIKGPFLFSYFIFIKETRRTLYVLVSSLIFISISNMTMSSFSFVRQTQVLKLLSLLLYGGVPALLKNLNYTQK